MKKREIIKKGFIYVGVAAITFIAIFFIMLHNVPTANSGEAKLVQERKDAISYLSQNYKGWEELESGQKEALICNYNK